MVDFSIHFTDAAIGLRGASKNKQNVDKNNSCRPTAVDHKKKDVPSERFFREIFVRTSTRTAHRWSSKKKICPTV